MAAETAALLTNPLVQWGFAGFSGVLIAVIVWLIGRLLDVIRENNKIIAEHTEIMRELGRTNREQFEIQVSIKDKLLSRPCIAQLTMVDGRHT